jgi:hypothetical protein
MIIEMLLVTSASSVTISCLLAWKIHKLQAKLNKTEQDLERNRGSAGLATRMFESAVEDLIKSEEACQNQSPSKPS